jgi:ribosomal protein S18 acetylase RimI-like enzyme
VFELRFEKARLQDAEALAKVQKRAFDLAENADKYGGGGPPGYDTTEWQAETMEQIPYYTILRDGAIVGGIVANAEPEPGHYYLKRLFVDPDFQNQGIASEALTFIENELPARRWTLHTPYLSFANQHFYEKRGYKKIGELRIEDLPDIPEAPKDFVLFHYEKIRE